MITYAFSFEKSSFLKLPTPTSKVNAAHTPTQAIESSVVAQPAATMLSQEDIEHQIAHYEQQFGMSSEEFSRRMREGTAPDTFETMDWMILLRNR